MVWFSKHARSGSGPQPTAPLFDDAFQKQLELLALVSRRITTGRTRAQRRSRSTGSGVELADFREYREGDDYRHVDWNAYGRLGRLLLRLYEQEEDLSVELLVDCSRSMAAGTPSKLDYAKKLAAALAYVSLSHLDRVAVTAYRDGTHRRLAAMRGGQRIFAVFDFLRPLTADGTTDLTAAAAELAVRSKRRATVILLSDLYDPQGFERGIDRLRYAKLDVHVIQLASSEDARPSLHGDLELVDAETGETRSVTITPTLLQRYRASHAQRQARIARYCAEKRVSLFLLDTQTSPTDAMLRILRRGGMLR
jgi:uncharacterized protein (DUF58 family)